jgi:hypothetical protein
MGQVVAICTVVTKIVAAVQAIHQVVNAVQEWRAKNKAASEKEVKDKVNEGMMQHKDLSNLNDAQNKALQGFVKGILAFLAVFALPNFILLPIASKMLFQPSCSRMENL